VHRKNYKIEKIAQKHNQHNYDNNFKKTESKKKKKGKSSPKVLVCVLGYGISGLNNSHFIFIDFQRMLYF
jgi:hypothetical protein